MKNIVLLFLLMLQTCFLWAQVDYTFSAASGGYNPLSGGSTATLSAAHPGGRSLLDESFANNIPVGFTIQYNGQNYSTIHLNANGLASLGAPFVANATDPGYDQNELRAATGFRGVTRPVLAPFWDNLIFSAATDLTYKTEGSAPNRVFTAQWQNMVWQSGAAAVSFQLKLYEGSNVIEFVYRQEGSAGAGVKSASIGITAEAGAALIDDDLGTYLSLNNVGNSPTASATAETETLTDRPATGQIYRFTPATCAGPAGLRVVSYSQSSATIQWTGRAGASGYQYGISNLDVPPTSPTATNQTTVTTTGLAPNQTYYFYIRNQCGSPWRVVSFKTPMLATVPYTEGFEAALDNALPSAMRRENGSSSFADVFWQTSNGVPAASGSKAALNTAPFVPAQTWLYTPGLSLVGGTAYKVDFKYATTTGTQALDVRWGTQVGAAAMTNSIFTNNNITNTGYQTNSGSFVAPTTGTYYVGFLYKSGINAGIFTLDDISITVTTNLVAVTGVSVSPVSVSLLAGATASLTATVAPANASNKNVSWSSGNAGVATVNSAGLVTAVAAGNAVITVTTADGNRTATSAITVTAPATNSKPVAVLNASPTTGVAPLLTSFNANGSSDPDPGNTITGYNWNFGDGSAAETSASPTHTYTTAGVYTATLRVKDNNSLFSDPVTRTITVTAPGGSTTATTTTLAQWDFAGKGGQNNLAATTKVADVNTATAKLGAGLAVINYLGNGLTGTEQMATNLAGALSGNDYFSFSVAPTAGKALTINKVDVRPVSQNRSRTFVVFSSVNGFASGQQVGTFTGQAGLGAGLSGITISNHTSLTATVEFRVYVYGPTEFYESVGVGNRNGATGSYDLAVLGSSAAIPAPPAPTPPVTTGTGTIIREYWTGKGGSQTSLIPLTKPVSGTAVLTSLEGPTKWGDDYGDRIRGYVIPTTTGAYTFYAAGDDYVDLYLSTTNNPANKTLIAYVSGWTNPREWAKYPTQKSAVVNLVAGQRYYVEILHKEATGGDNVAIGWIGPGISTITVIGGANIAPFQPTGGGRLGVADVSGVIRLYPNPVGEEFTVSGLAAESVLEIVGQEGRILKRQEQVIDQSRIATGTLPTGLYLIRITNAVQGVVIQKLIKQ